MTAPDVTGELQPGDPTSPEAAAFLEKFDRYIQLPLILAAVVPIILGLGDEQSIATGMVFVVSWLVFLADLVVHMWKTHHYLRTVRGKFDLVVVVLTAPWFLITPGLSQSRFIVVVRLARLVRLMVASRAARNLLNRVGRAAIVALIMVVVCSYVTWQAEKSVNPEFSSFDQSMWWGIVTITTVGYGDKVPITAIGRWSAVVLMVTGIGIIGTLAGSLSNFLRLAKPEQPADGKPDSADATETPTASDALTIAELRAQLAALDSQLEKLQGAQISEADTPPE